MFQDVASDKFWNLETSGSSYTVTFGKTGTTGQAQTKNFDSEEKCLKEAEKLVNEKIRKGYKENSSIDFLAEWKSMHDTKSPQEAFFHHFSFLRKPKRIRIFFENFRITLPLSW
nr:WGR domain-containing protein [Leptospira stimsonii]